MPGLAITAVNKIHISSFPGGASRKKKKKNPASVGDTRDAGSIPGLGRSHGVGNGNPLQYFGLRNPMDRGIWQATVHGVTENWT